MVLLDNLIVTLRMDAVQNSSSDILIEYKSTGYSYGLCVSTGFLTPSLRYL